MAILKQKVKGVAKPISTVSAQDINAVVHTAGNENIAGTKTFTASPIVPTVADASDNSMKVASTAFVQKLIRKAVVVTGESGTLSASDLAVLKADNRAVIVRNGIVYNFVSLSGGALHYVAVNRSVTIYETILRIDVAETNGAWTTSANPLIVRTVDDKSTTTLTNPTGVSGQCWYRVKNNMVTVGANGLSATGRGFFNFTDFPAMYKPVEGQVCATIMALNTNPGNTALLYVDQVCVKFRPYEAGSDFYGSVSYMI